MRVPQGVAADTCWRPAGLPAYARVHAPVHAIAHIMVTANTARPPITSNSAHSARQTPFSTPPRSPPHSDRTVRTPMAPWIETAVSIHGAIGVRTVLSEWGGLRGGVLNGVCLALCALLLVMGGRAVLAVTMI